MKSSIKRRQSSLTEYRLSFAKTKPRTSRVFYLTYFAPRDKARHVVASTCVIANFNPHINKQMPFQVIKSMPRLSTGENEVIVPIIL